jgi:hypothetical protein
VKVTSGDLQNLQGTVERVDPDGQVRTLIPLMRIRPGRIGDGTYGGGCLATHQVIRQVTVSWVDSIAQTPTLMCRWCCDRRWTTSPS